MIGNNKATLFVNNESLMVKNKVALFTIWDASVNQLEVWAVFYVVFIGDPVLHPEKFDM